MGATSVVGVEPSGDLSGRARDTASACASDESQRQQGRTRREELAVARVFASTALRYGASVLPAATRELSRWRKRAEQIPDAALRRHALEALGKRGNMEGAALFAAFAPRATRAHAVRALVAFQAAYNYLDALAEQRCDDPMANGRQLHEALLLALDSSEGAQRRSHPNYYEQHPQREDGGYLIDMVEACRGALAALPSYATVASSAHAAAARVVGFQSLNLGERQGDPAGLERWARLQAPPTSGLEWWETAAACGSSLGVHVLIGLAAEPSIDRRRLPPIESAYFPWIGALHSLLDSAIDVAEDRREGQRNLLSYYPSPAHAAARMGWLAERANRETQRLDRDERQPPDCRERVILTAIVAYYLSSPSASAPTARLIASSVTDAIGPLTKPALVLFRVARVLSRLRGPRVGDG
jgi:tetraprenyl-beta-curcumene synthase